MARYRPVDMSPRFLPVVLEEQLVPGTFADAVHRLVDVLDLSAFDARYRNDTTGAPAHAPGMLLKAVLLAYSQGIVSSRRIERACRENVLFIAITGDAKPHSRRLGTVEPVFGNLRYNKGLRRLTLRASAKSMVSGSCSRWSTTSRSGRIAGKRHEKGSEEARLRPCARDRCSWNTTHAPHKGVGGRSRQNAEAVYCKKMRAFTAENGFFYSL